MLQYVLPEAVQNSSQGCPVVCAETPQSALPAASAAWCRLGAHLAAPEPGEQLEADRTQVFALRVPGAHEVALVPRCHALQWQHTSEHLTAAAAHVGDAVDDSGIGGATTVPWNEGEQAFWAELVVPRADMLDVVARTGPASPWQQLLRFQLLPESQHLRERLDLIFEPPVPDKRDPKFSLVRLSCRLCRRQLLWRLCNAWPPLGVQSPSSKWARRDARFHTFASLPRSPWL